mgnify:CR=1 FL=1
MLVLGIDPGLAITGYGFIEVNQHRKYSCVDYGVIRTESGLPDPERLVVIFDTLTELIHHLQPDTSTVEKLFFQKNVKTALSVGQARGVVMLALAQANLPIHEYTPNEIKQTISGYGNAGKRQMQRMVQTLLSLEDLPKPDDAADALAVAICHIHHQSFNNLMQEN